MASTVDWRRLGLRLQAFLPMLLLGVLALVTYWLVQNSPILHEASPETRKSGKPDAFFYRFQLVSLDDKGQWQMQISGDRALHREDQKIYEVDQPRMVKQDGVTQVKTLISAQRARASDDGTQVELFGQAAIERKAQVDALGKSQEAFEVRSEYLMLDDRRQMIQTHLPVTLKKGSDQMSAERMTALQLEGQLQLEGRVRGTLAPRRN